MSGWVWAVVYVWALVILILDDRQCRRVLQKVRVFVSGSFFDQSSLQR